MNNHFNEKEARTPDSVLGAAHLHKRLLALICVCVGAEVEGTEQVLIDTNISNVPLGRCLPDEHKHAVCRVLKLVHSLAGHSL